MNIKLMAKYYLQKTFQENDLVNQYLSVTASNIETLKKLDAALGKPL